MFLGNNAALDFINTQVIRRGEVVDLLQSESDLNRWAQEAGRSLEHELDQEDMAKAKILRSALAKLFRAVIEGTSVTDQSLDIVNRHLSEHAPHEILNVNDSDQFELKTDTSALNLTTLLAEIAHEAAQLLASPQVSHIKRCGNRDCILLFLDTSRSKKRRWCSMDTCGNRAKAARHYRSQSQ